MLTKRVRKSGFTLLELVIVVVIIGIIAAIAVPRMSRASSGASDKALAGDLAVLRNAIDMYGAEHNGAYPGVATAVTQLTKYTDNNGNDANASDSTHIYGPYLRSSPALPVGTRKGGTDVAAADGNTVGWIYTAATGNIRANCAAGEVDSSGTRYMDY
jgi:prepilin-type N-terminal cleavage/methylation domain-containing protein